MATALSPEIAKKIRDHGAETYPHECCGALLGRDLDPGVSSDPGAAKLPTREIVALHPLVNRRDDSPRNRFSVTSDDVREAEKAATEKGIEVVGWYHSHPDHPAAPSEYDRDHAWPWYSYIIVSVATGQPQDMTSWRLSDDRSQFTCEALEIRESAKA
jgi:proteasome lid subunit RPN8/RPN11